MDITRRIDAPPAAVWEQLASTRHWPHWGPTVTGVDPPDDVVRPGLRGRVTTPVGVRLPFEVTSVEPGRRWHWSVAGVAATDHRVEPHGDGTLVTIRVRAWAPFYAPVCVLGLRRLAARAEAAVQR